MDYRSDRITITVKQTRHMRKALWLLSLLLGITLTTAAAKEKEKVKGKVVRVIDGDTFEVLVGKTPYRIRMSAIDAPERGQDYYKVSREALASQCFSQTVTVLLLSKDRYQRWIGDLYNEKGLHVNAWMVENGYAWHYVQYSRSSAMAAAETQARQKHAGLWAQKNPLAPWEFRAEKRNRSAKTVK